MFSIVSISCFLNSDSSIVIVLERKLDIMVIHYSKVGKILDLWEKVKAVLYVPVQKVPSTLSYASIDVQLLLTANYYG